MISIALNYWFSGTKFVFDDLNNFLFVKWEVSMFILMRLFQRILIKNIGINSTRIFLNLLANFILELTQFLIISLLKFIKLRSNSIIYESHDIICF